MTAGFDQPSPEDDWMMLDEACRLASPEKIAAWCRDGVVASQAGLRISRIRHLDIGTNETIKEENVALDPADWASEELRNPLGIHWQGGEARFDFGDNPGRLFGLFMTLLGGTLYRIQVNRDDLNRMLATAPPKARAGRPPGGGYRQTDKPIVEKMRAGLASGLFASSYAAGLHYAGETKGPGSLESKARRLASRLKVSE